MFENSGTAKIREAIVSGIFYPEDSSELRASVTHALESAQPAVSGARAILSPHAGFDYSEALSASAWKAASDRPIRNVVILAPYHRSEDTCVYLPESDFFKTPLGKIPVNRRYIEELESSGTLFHINDIPHLEEHSIEIQLPFMKSVFPDASLVPILMGKPLPSTITSLAHSLDLVFSDSTDSVLFVVSSNFSGFPSAEDSDRRFRRILTYISAQDDSALYEEYKSDTPDMCGVGCVAALLRSSIVKGCTWSLRGTGDSSSKRASASEKVVLYAAGVWA